MKRILSVCSMFLLLFTSLAHADISHHSPSLFNTKSKYLSVEKKSTSIKYAGVIFITEYGKDGSFSGLSYPKAPVVCSSSQYPLGESPEHCCSVDTCTDSNSVTHYGCKTCCPGYSKKNNACSADDCTGYGSTGCEIEHCATLESGDCHKNVDSCQKGDEKVYKCLECEQGYEVNSEGGCSPILCSRTDYPYTERPTICYGEPLVCHGGEDVYYGCPGCLPGCIKSNGSCLSPTCEENEHIDENDVCSCVCNSGYERIATGCVPVCVNHATRNSSGTCVCDTGYESYNGACVIQCAENEIRNESGVCVSAHPSPAIAFTVTTKAASQGITIKTVGAAHIDWGDGNVQDVTGTGTTTAHSYTTAGSYDVYVTGTPTGFAVTAGQTYLTKLLDISLPSITSYDKAFWLAKNMTGDLTNMEFPSGLKNGADMFNGCSGLTGTIPELPSGLYNGKEMFASCSGLTGTIPELPSGLRSGDSMFAGCSGLTGNIPEIPSGITFGQGMFYGCSGLTGGIPELPDELYNGHLMFADCSGLTGNVPELPSSIEDGEGMFEGCSGLTGGIPTLPSGLTNGKSMFEGCSGLNGTITENNPTLPSGLTNGYAMFRNCTALTGGIPTLPEELTNGESMFEGCSGLTGGIPTLPTNLTQGALMFWNCSGLTGQCPIKPDSLTDYDNMYFNTGVCCDYGGATATGCACDRNIYPYSTSEWSCYVNETDGEGHCDYCTDSTGTYMAVTCSLEDYSPDPYAGRVGCVMNANCPTEGVGWIHRDTFGTDPNIIAHCANLRWCQFDSSYAKCYKCDDGYTLTHNPAHVCEEQ